jgi:hypothetical protein
MSIAPKQIGWSQESNLLWEISKQLDRLNTQMCTGGCPTTTTTTTTTFIPPGAIQFPILIGYETILPVEDIVVSNTLEDMCLFVNNSNNENVNPDSLIVDGTTYYFDPETYILYNSVTNTFAEDGYYTGEPFLQVIDGLAQIINPFVLCVITTTTTTTVNLCRSYTITNLLSEDTTYSYINCEGVSVLDVPILDGANATFCALLDTVNFNSEIVDNGLCT